MNALKAVMTVFIVLETANVIALYFFPDARYANSVGVFRAWGLSKQDPDMHAFVKYLVNWVAGTKLIFLGLLIVIVWTADDRGLFFAGVAMAVTISSFFWRLFPLARSMDRAGQMEPKNYSLVLAGMIAVMVVLFVGALAITGTG